MRGFRMMNEKMRNVFNEVGAILLTIFCAWCLFQCFVLTVLGSMVIIGGKLTLVNIVLVVVLFCIGCVLVIWLGDLIRDVKKNAMKRKERRKA